MNSRTTLGMVLPILGATLLLSCATTPKPLGQVADSPDLIIHHRGEPERTLQELQALVTATRARITLDLGVDVPKTELFLYQDQREFQVQKYGVLALILNLPWYIGDNMGEKALLVSPSTPVKGHDYQSIINAGAHEYVHTVVYRMNPKCPLWINEGVALYFSNRSTDVSVSSQSIPKPAIFETNDPVFFAQNNGYAYADKFIEFVEQSWGRDGVRNLILTGRISQVLGLGLEETYLRWVRFLKARYP